MKREELFTKIITQIGQGNQDDYETLAREIEQREEMTLGEEYQAILEKIKDNPMEEKKLADIIEKSSKQECSQFEIAALALGKEFVKANDMEQVALLVGKIVGKIMSFRDDKGVVKKTKSFDSYEPMKPSDRMNFENLKIELSKITDEKEQEKANEKLDAFISKATNIDVKSLTTWEHRLLQELLEQEAKGISMIFLGKK